MSAVAPTQIESPEVWTRLESSPEWAALTDSQRVWVTQFLATGSALLATQAGYKAKSEASNRVLSYELAKNKTIGAALDVANGKVKTDRERLIDDVRAHLKAAEKGSVAASKFAAQLERLVLGAKPEAEDVPETPEAPSATKFHIGQLVNQRDEDGVVHTGRVLAIDANGSPTEIEEVS
jgi:hypothetical protein